MDMDDDLTPITEPSQADAESDARAGKQMSIAAVVITAFLVVGRIMGTGKEMVLSSLGKGAHTDAYKIVYDSIIFTIYTKVEKLMRPTYLPEFVRVKREQGEEAAWAITSVMTGFQFLLLLVIAALCVIFAEPLLLFVGTGLRNSPQDLHRGVVMIRIMAPALVIFSLSVMPELTLHAYKRFTLPAIAEATYRSTLAVLFFILVKALWPGHSPDAVYGAAYAVLVGGCLRFFLQLPGLRRHLGMFRFTANVLANPSARTIVGLMPPVVLGLIFATIRQIADSRFGSDIAPGAYSSLRWGRNIPDVVGQLLPLAVSFVVYPFLSEWAIRGERGKMADALVKMTRAMAFIFIPLSVGMMLLATPIIRLVFQQGEFKASDAELPALSLYWYAPGLFFTSVDAAINHWYFAFKDTTTPNLMGVVFVVVHVVMSWLGVYRFGTTPKAQLSWVAAALTFSKGGKIVVLYSMIRRRIGHVDGRAVGLFCLKLAAACALMGAVMWLAQGRLEPRLELWRAGQTGVGTVKLRALLEIAACGLLGGVVFLGAAAAARVEELRIVGDAFVKVIGKVMDKLGGGRGQ